MAQNKISDLNNHLFAQLERLGEEDLKGENLKEEIERSRALAGIAKQIIQNTQNALEIVKFLDETGYASSDMSENLRLLGVKNEKI